MCFPFRSVNEHVTLVPTPDEIVSFLTKLGAEELAQPLEGDVRGWGGRGWQDRSTLARKAAAHQLWKFLGILTNITEVSLVLLTKLLTTNKAI